MATKDCLEKDKFYRPILGTSELIQLLLEGKNINSLLVNDTEDIQLYNEYKEDLLNNPATFDDNLNSMDLDSFHEMRSTIWKFPVKYHQIDVYNMVLAKCKTNEERERVKFEYREFEKNNSVMILRLFIWLVDYMRENNILWGVGRGSSVCSYILYLIGIHRVDCLKYNLPFTFFENEGNICQSTKHTKV